MIRPACGSIANGKVVMKMSDLSFSMKAFFTAIDRLRRTTRLLISLVLGTVVFLFLYTPAGAAIGFLCSWLVFAATMLLFSWVTILTRKPQQTGTLAEQQDEGLLLVFLLVVTAAFISLFAVILLLNGAPAANRDRLSLHIVLSLLAIALSWLLIHSLFAIRYAHLYYRAGIDKLNGEGQGGLLFPGNEPPDFLDFAYFSFVLAMTFQTADVNITGRHIRRLALVQGLLSFVYNTTIIALLINIVSGLIGSK